MYATSVWKELIDAVYDVSKISSHAVTKLSARLFIQACFFKFSWNPQSLLHLQAYVLGFQKWSSFHNLSFIALLHSHWHWLLLPFWSELRFLPLDFYLQLYEIPFINIFHLFTFFIILIIFKFTSFALFKIHILSDKSLEYYKFHDISVN